MSRYRVKTRRRCPHISLYFVPAKVSSFILGTAYISQNIQVLHTCTASVVDISVSMSSIRSDPESVVWCLSSEKESYNPINPGIVSSLTITEPTLNGSHSRPFFTLPSLLLCNWEWGGPSNNFQHPMGSDTRHLTRFQFVLWITWVNYTRVQARELLQLVLVYLLLWCP